MGTSRATYKDISLDGRIRSCSGSSTPRFMAHTQNYSLVSHQMLPPKRMEHGSSPGGVSFLSVQILKREVSPKNKAGPESARNSGSGVRIKSSPICDECFLQYFVYCL